MDPRPVVATNDGIEIAALDWGGAGPPLLLGHPNGFPAGVFDPLARTLCDAFRPIAVDVRGHGGSEHPGDLATCTFANGARDVLAVLDVLGIHEVVALGQSMGGAVIALADAMRPGLVRKVMLCEAIAFPPAASSASTRNVMAEGARKRRAVWPDRATVRESYGRRPPLASIEPAALAAYVRYGFHDRPDGSVELACAPEVEAAFFEQAAGPDGAPRAFAHLGPMRAPITVVSGTDTDLHVPWFEEQAEAAHGTHLEVSGTHFFVQEDTARAASLVREHLSW